MINYKKFYLAKYKFLLSAEEELDLPPFKGSTLRGGFGRIFRDLSCMDKRRKDCHGCILKDKCPYSYIFDTSPRLDSPYLKKIEDIPRPFILEVPFEKKETFFCEKSLSFNLILIGKGIDYFPYFVVAFRELGNVGLGKNRKKFLLKEIWADGEESREKVIIFSFEEGVVKNFDNRITWAKIVDKFKKEKDLTNLKYWGIDFVTPTRIKYQDEFIGVPEFHIIIRSLLRRISNLAYFHCGEKLNINFNYLINQATKIKIDKIKVEWVDWERYSFIQERRMKLGGFIGEVIYKGDLSKFLPFLLLGEYTHIGKGATFGLGLYRLVPKIND